MPGASLIPVDSPGDHEDVADLLSIARVTWNRGDHEAAVSFVQRAAQTAMELELELRGLELAKVAAELKATVSQPPAPVRLPGPGPGPAGSTAPSPSVAARAYPSMTATPQLVLVSSRPPAAVEETDIDRPAVRPPVPSPELMDDEPATIPHPSALPSPNQVMMLSGDDLDDVPQRDTSIDVPPAHAVASPIKSSVKGLSQAPRPSPLASTTAGASRAPNAASPARSSGTPPPLPSHRPSATAAALQGSKPPGAAAVPSSLAHAAGRFASSPVPPKVSSVRPPGGAPAPAPAPGPAAASASRAPLPLRVKGDEGRAAGTETPAPPMVSGSADPGAVRRSSPWIDEVVAPIAGGGGAPVVVGLRARIHFRTDGSLELGPDAEGGTGLPVIVLPQRGEDMSTLLKRLAARKR